MFTPAFTFASTLQEEVGVAPPEPAAVLRRDLPKGDGVHVLGVQTLRPPGGHRHAGGGRVRAGGAGEIAVQSSVVAGLAVAVTSRLVGCFRPQVKMQDKDVTFALKVIKKKHVVDNRQEEHIHSERKILAEARSPFVVKSVPSTGPQTGFHVLFWSWAWWPQGWGAGQGPSHLVFLRPRSGLSSRYQETAGWWSSAPSVWENSGWLISFLQDQGRRPKQITAPGLGEMAGNIEMNAIKTELLGLKHRWLSPAWWSNFTRGAAGILKPFFLSCLGCFNDDF